MRDDGDLRELRGSFFGLSKLLRKLTLLENEGVHGLQGIWNGSKTSTGSGLSYEALKNVNGEGIFGPSKG